MSDVTVDVSATDDDASDLPDDGNDLGPAGEKALDAWKQRARTAEGKSKELRAAAKERDELRARLEEYEASSKTETQRQLEQAVKEAEERVRSEMSTTVNSRLIKAEIRAAASGTLADPEDAVRFIDFTEFEVGDDGTVDGKAIRSAIDDLVKQKPYLAGKTRPQGDIDQGARKNGDTNVEPGLPRLTRAYAQNG